MLLPNRSKNNHFMKEQTRLLLSQQLPLAVKQMADTLKLTKTIEFDSFLTLRTQLQSLNTPPQIITDLNTFTFLLSQFPGIWAHLFVSEKITSRSSHIQLGDYVYAFNRELHNRVSKVENHRLFLELAKQEIKGYFLIITKLLVDSYNRCRERLEQKVKDINSISTMDVYTNKYIIFKLLKEFSAESLNDCKVYLLPLFERVEYHEFRKFVRWVVKKHELITLRIDKKPESWVTEKKMEDKGDFKERLEKVLHTLRLEKENIGFTPAQREDGKYGILILQRITDVNRKVLIFSDDYNSVVVMTCNLMNMKWKSKVHSKQLLNPQLPLQNTIDHLLTNSETFTEKLVNSEQISNYEDTVENLGEVLGNCIANFRDYDSILAFLKEFSKSVISAGILGILVGKVPLVGKLLFVGGFSEEIVKILFSQYKTFSHKLENLGKIVVDTTITVAGAVAGFVIGEIVVPVMILGPLLGGIVGGYYTAKWVKQADTELLDERLERIKKGLVLELHHQGWWKHSDQLLNLFQIKQSYFNKTVPNLNSNDDKSLWMTALCFFILSYFQSTKDQQDMKKKIQIEENKQSAKAKVDEYGLIKKQEQQEIAVQLAREESLIQKEQREVKEEAKRVRGEYHYSSLMISKDLEKCLFYLEKRNFKVIDHLQELSDLMIKVLAI